MFVFLPPAERLRAINSSRQWSHISLSLSLSVVGAEVRASLTERVQLPPETPSAQLSLPLPSPPPCVQSQEELSPLNLIHR